MKPYVIVANFGNESIALIQWCIDMSLEKDIIVCSVDTGWQAKCWQTRVNKAHLWMEKNQIAYQRLRATHTMSECVKERQAFPSKKFQWCAGFLKGLILNDFLDEIDAPCEKTLVFAKREQASKANRFLQEYEHSSHFGDRRVWYPLLKVSDDTMFALVKRAGFKQLSHQSLECAPCIHVSSSMLNVLSKEDVERCEHLEQEIGRTMFESPIAQYIQDRVKESNGSTNNYLAHLDMGCGSEFGCGE